MASFSSPKLSNRIADDVPAIQEILGSLAKLTPDSGNTDYPNGTKRVDETTNGYEFQQWNGSSWVHLEKWNINAQKVDGYSASTGTTANTIPVRNANGKLPGDILGNAATATKATALSETNPIAAGGTGATTAEQARANLGTPPKSHASSSDEFGGGSSTQYGHTKTHDEPDATLTAAAGHAFSPAGAAAMQGEIDGKLDKSGGTMTGPLTGTAYVQKLSGIDVTATPNASTYGNTIRFTDKNDKLFAMLQPVQWSNGGNALRFIISKKDGSQGGSLTLEEHGNGSTRSLTFDGNDVLTSNGGTMTGAFVNATLTRNNLSGQTEIYGGTTGSNGAYIALYGQSCTDGYGSGKLLLRAANKGTKTDVTIDPGRGMYVDGKEVLCIASEWNDGNGNWYRKYNDGFTIQCVHFSHNNSMPKAISLPIPFKDTNFWAMTSDLYNIHFRIPTNNQTVMFQESITSTMNYTLIALGY